MMWLLLMLPADTHGDKAGVDIVGAGATRFGQQFHSVVIV